ncbi:cellulose synthase-like protein E1 isoform X2 [Syzygium oleosum]|uniref:cellulose synthase-like protein E1 isoform X2 n=1 Tax=Syzygium oleosum TaxID=219896 RepID=UPI0024BB6262|nr:cellulose synthase-like protein E1 isoform X2 [Syzygium oleosum]
MCRVNRSTVRFGFGSACLRLSCGSASTGFSCKLAAGDSSIAAPSRIGSLTVMAYDYPPEKMSVYLSDDAGSNITYYALLEASQFAKHWIPFCRRFTVEPRSPAAYFRSPSSDQLSANGKNEELSAIKKLYEDMKNRIETAHELGRISEDIRSKHKEFSQWDSYISRQDHNTFLEILIDRTTRKAVDAEGNALSTLVYMAREKRPQYFHNFKAGAMNALIRVSSAISSGRIILNVDCDMYSNNSESIRDALCFLMDEERGDEIAYVQFPQNFENVTKNEQYSSSLRVISEVEFHGLDGQGGVLYIGSGCFHRRDTLCGKKIGREVITRWSENSGIDPNGGIYKPEELKKLASCSYEENTEWGREMGLKYGCPVEDVITGLSIQYRGWRSVYFNPRRNAFLGVAPTTLLQLLVQHKRWSEGDFQILLSRYSPAWHGLGKISPGLIMCYLPYCLWAPNCLPTLYYTIIPSLCLLKGISLFPEVTSPWFIPFAYVIFCKYAYSLAEYLWSGGTVLGWWNDQRIWLYKRTSSYLFAAIDTVAKLLGFSETAFVITSKVAEEGVAQRYEKEMMEFGATSPMFTILTTLALLNLVCFLGAALTGFASGGAGFFGSMLLQAILCAVLILINLPIYHGILRKDEGKMPISTTVASTVIAVSACTIFVSF